MNSPSQEIHRARSMLILDQGQEQHDMGQWEEAQTCLRVMMIVRLHKGEEDLPSHTLKE
jgi:hypothetical protein